jgi:putative transposase
MRVLKTYRFRLELGPTTAHTLRRIAGSCRFVFNRALETQRSRLERNEKRLGYAGLCRSLTDWRHSPETAFLAEVPVHPLQQALKDLDRAYRNFFEGRAELPRFKKKGVRDAFRYPDATQFAVDDTNGRVKLPKVGWVRYRRSRSTAGTPKQLTIVREGSHWFVSIHAEQEVEARPEPAGGPVGVDMGIAKFAALSTGETFSPVNAFRTHRKKLAHEQRALARKSKLSNNWRKQKARVQQLHLKIRRIRNDFLHKTSTTISKNHAVIVLEDLAVKSMSKRARGTLDRPSRNIRARASLNASILDQGWAEFRRQLEYKQAWRGGRVVAVSPRNTSRICSACGHSDSRNRPLPSVFRCVRCGHAADPDVNAARNILAAGHAVIACGERCIRDRSPKQEPSVATADPVA